MTGTATGDAFYTSNFLAGDDRTVYKAVNISSTPAKEVVGKYYEVVKVWTKTDYLSAGCCLLLREKKAAMRCIITRSSIR